MQVKKFEAKSMKEALELVKRHLGPEAIILSAKDNSKGFGLIGEKSVEVTAAISEETLRRKQFAETKLNETHRERYMVSPARRQREFIDRAFNDWKELQEVKSRSITARPYIDITDEEEGNKPSAQHVRDQIRQLAAAAQPAGGEDNDVAQKRIKSAAALAWKAVQSVDDDELKARHEHSRRRRLIPENDDINVLRKEIHHLKNIIESLNKKHQEPKPTITMHPGAHDGVPYELSFMYEKLTKAGVSQRNSIEILKRAQEELSLAHLQKKAFVDAWVARYLLDRVRVVGDRVSSRFHAFVGPAGQGKTSSLVKLASHMVICEKKKIALLTTDSVKVGAAEQLRIYAQILNVPFAVLRRPEDWEAVNSKLRHVDHILVDYPGYNLKSVREIDTIRELLPPSEGGRDVHYVQSVLAKDEDAFEIANRYQMLGLNDVIFTALDEAVQHGLIYNFQQKFALPLHSFGIGSQIPEDFEPATKERVVDLIFKLTKVRKGRGIA